MYEMTGDSYRYIQVVGLLADVGDLLFIHVATCSHVTVVTQGW